MHRLLETKRMSIIPTIRCTLKCKLCSNHIPAFKQTVDATVDEMVRDIDLLFELFDRIEWLQFVGGEIFLHDGMSEVYEYCQKYRTRFNKLILETNATLLPRQKEIEALSKFGSEVTVMISDYGELSVKSNDFIRILEENEIPYIIKKYYGMDQHVGGWIDNTGRKNYGESQDTIQKTYPNCPQKRIENMHCYRGELHSCPNSLFMSLLNISVPDKRDFVNLLDNSQNLEKKRQIIHQFYTNPPRACHFCMWRYAETMKRYPAAEQIF